MRKLSYVLAAVATIAVPTIAAAQDFDVRVGGDRDHYRGPRTEYREYRGPRAEYRGPRAEFYGPRFHRGYNTDRGVVIRRHYDEY